MTLEIIKEIIDENNHEKWINLSEIVSNRMKNRNTNEVTKFEGFSVDI